MRTVIYIFINNGRSLPPLQPRKRAVGSTSSFSSSHRPVRAPGFSSTYVRFGVNGRHWGNMPEGAVAVSPARSGCLMGREPLPPI